MHQVRRLTDGVPCPVTPVELVRARLEARGCNIAQDRGATFEAQCPAHEDRNPSLSVSTGQDGRGLVKCHAGCRQEDVLEALDMTWTDLFSEDTAPSADDWTVEAEYIYQDAQGTPIFKVVRFSGKRFRQQRRLAGAWEWGLQGVTRQLYHLPEVLAAKERGDFILLTEGEKDADAVRAAGLCGTTMPGGAGKQWERQYTEALSGAKVIVLADDDEVGQQHAAQVWRTLQGRAARVVARLPAEGCKDVADHLAAGHPLTKEALRPLLLVDLTPAVANGHGRATMTARAFASRPSSSEALELLGPMFQRGMRTVIGAQTGEGKTSFALYAIRALIEQESFLGESRWRGRRGAARALVVDLEQGEETVKARLQETGLDTSERVDILWEPSGIAIDRREEDRAMVQDVIREGHYDLVLFDPLYQLHLGSGNDEEVASSTMRIIDGWAREFNTSVLLPMHMRKPHPNAGKNISIHEIAGVGTWLRNAEFVLALQFMSQGHSKLHFFKDRIGRGPEIRSYWWLAFDRSDGGFKRSYKEERDRITAEMRALLARDEGVTRPELLALLNDETFVQRILQGKHRDGDRYRSRAWTVHRGQVSME